LSSSINVLAGPLKVFDILAQSTR